MRFLLPNLLRLPTLICKTNLKNYCCTRNKWNVIFFGGDDFSIPSLAELHHEYIKGNIGRLEVVTTSASKNNSVLKFTQENSLISHSWPAYKPNKDHFHVGIVVSFGHLIPKRVIDSFSLGVLNVHASLLPRWRGAAPIIHCLLNGESITGVTIMKIKPHHFDIGDIICQKSVDISQDILQPELHYILAKMGANMIVECVHTLPNCLNNAYSQDSSLATLAPKIDKSLSIVNWKNATALQVYNLYRALYGIHPLVNNFYNHSINFTHMHLSQNDYLESNKKRPGCFEYSKKYKSLRVWCKDGHVVYIDKLKVKGKPEMSAIDFRNGFMKNVPAEELYFV